VCVLSTVRSEYQGRITESIHQAFVAAENLRMFLVRLICCFAFSIILAFTCFT